MEMTTVRRDLLQRRAWIFDLDGTLTMAVHDFPAIRRRLGIPENQPILEYIDRQPAPRALEIRRELDDIEREVAATARPSPGADALLGELHERRRRIAILTRNSYRNALLTLDAAGLRNHFRDEDVYCRDRAAPKPSPDGIRLILATWQIPADETLIVGDFRYDMEAGRAAGIATIYYDCRNENLWNDQADWRIGSLDELRRRLEQPVTWESSR